MQVDVPCSVRARVREHARIHFDNVWCQNCVRCLTRFFRHLNSEWRVDDAEWFAHAVTSQDRFVHLVNDCVWCRCHDVRLKSRCIVEKFVCRFNKRSELLETPRSLLEDRLRLTDGLTFRCPVRLDAAVPRLSFVNVEREVVATTDDDVVLCEPGDVHEFLNTSDTEPLTFLVIRTNDIGYDDMIWEEA